MESVPEDNSGLRVCQEDGFELEDKGFPDNSALKEIMLLNCICKHEIEGCGWAGPLIEVKDHMDQCEYNIDMPCKYVDVGCKFVGGRNARKNHTIEDEMWHQNLILGEVNNISRDIGQNKFMMRKIESENESLPLQILSDNLKKLEDTMKSVEDVENDPDSLTFVKEIQDAENVRDYVLRQQMQLTQLQLKATEETQKLVELVRDNQNTTINLDDRVSQLQLKASRMNGTHVNNQRLMKDVELKAKLLSTFHYTWKVDNLYSRQVDALTGKIPELFTPPLYTSRYGYKFCAKLLLNGTVREGERSQYIALYIILMKGDYDDTLVWPFPHTCLLYTSPSPRDS